MSFQGIMTSKKASNDSGFCPIRGQNTSLGIRTGDVFGGTFVFILRKTPAVEALHLRFNWLRSVRRTIHCCARQKVKGGCRKLLSVGRRHYLDDQIKGPERGMREEK